MIIVVILALLVALIAVIFAVSNTDIVSVSFLTFELSEQPLAVVILLTLLIGVIIGVLATTPGLVRRSWTIGSQKRKIDSLDKELLGRKSELEQIKQALEKKDKPEPPMEKPTIGPNV